MNSSPLAISQPEDPSVQYHENALPKLNTPAVLADNYEYLLQIGSGTQGNIYKARELKNNHIVAIKQLRIDQVENWKSYDLFEREAEVLSRLNIPGVAKFYEAFKCFDDDPPSAFIVQEYIDGVSLESYIQGGQRWTIGRVFDIGMQILDILEQLHHSDPPVIHRDLKPGNIMINKQNGKDRVYLIDFGAVANPVLQGGGSTVAGTFGYMPPEQLIGKPGPASDLYALAATLVYMLSGVSPLDIQTLEFRLVIEPHLQAFPAAVMHLLGKMLEPSVDKRLTDYHEIRQSFSRFVKSDFRESDETNDLYYISDEYFKQFKSVKTLWDNGNLKLWSALPDRTPRNVYNELLNLELATLRARPKSESQWSSVIIKKLLVTGFYSIPIIIGAWMLIGITDSMFFTDFISGFVGVVIVLLMLVFVCIIIVEWSVVYSIIATSFKENQALKMKLTDSPMLYLLLAHGQKSIATIVSVQYVPPKELNYKKYTFEEVYDAIGEYYYGIPSFSVCYKFNPPDDSMDEDLVHHITIHRDPGDQLQPGDPLPILYWIQDDSNDDVYSMPYPFAICDTENGNDLICHTKHGVIVDD